MDWSSSSSREAFVLEKWKETVHGILARKIMSF
jgi:hypothetical protein